MAKVIASGINNQNKYTRLIMLNDNNNVIYNNNNSSKYRLYTNSVKAYNSAFWHRSSNTQYLMTLLLEQSDTVKWQTSSDNINWTDAVSTPFTSQYNNVYSTGTSTTVDGYYIIQFALNGWISITTDIPVFENGSEYNAYMSSLYVSYTWSPVNKINGKMGNVNLSQIIYLNDGDPVTGADSEDVTFVDESGLDVLIEKAVWVDDAVTVEYYIPNDTFEYVKLVYKYGDVPADVNDGTAIDLDPNKTSLVITDIENPDNYWFIIFTDKSCSLGYELIINQDTALYNLLSGMF